MASDHILTADEIWAANDIEERVVPVPQWGGAVKIRTFSQKQADDMRRQSTGPNPNKPGRPVEVDMEEFQARLLIEGMVEPKFTMADYPRLQEKSAVAVTSILKAIMDASGMTQAAVAEADKSPGNGQDTLLRVPVGAGTQNDTGRVDKANVGE